MNLSRWISINKISSETGIPYSTLWRIIHKHIQYLSTKKNGKYNLYDREQIPLLNKIYKMYQDGMRYDEIDAELSESSPATLDITPSETDASKKRIDYGEETLKIFRSLSDNKQDMDLLKKMITSQEEEIQRLKQIVLSQDKKIKDLQTEIDSLEDKISESVMVMVNEYLAEVTYNKK